VKKIVPVILAGGIGERFWPLSRSSHPKQLLALTSRATLIEDTFGRAAAIRSRNTLPLVITGRTIAGRMKALLAGQWRYDCIVEPVGKNTAPAVALAAAWVQARYGVSIIAVLPADHLIRPRHEFAKAIRFASALADAGGQLVVFGVPPVRPDTGYGYIELGGRTGEQGGVESFVVARFVEKPDAKMAMRYCSSPRYRWNSGMFVWRTDILLGEVGAYMPTLYGQVMTAAKKQFSKKAIDAFYRAADQESVDYGIMERSKRVSAVSAPFFWDDIGSWESLTRINPVNKNGTTVIGGRVFEAECENALIVNKSRLTMATVGCRDIAVVATNDALLVIARSKLPEIKKYLGCMKKSKTFPRELF
jgi:mannose-1-phosphate guanylyltransferase/mannose-6-phosphate isomerase